MKLLALVVVLVAGLATAVRSGEIEACPAVSPCSCPRVAAAQDGAAYICYSETKSHCSQDGLVLGSGVSSAGSCAPDSTTPEQGGSRTILQTKGKRDGGSRDGNHRNPKPGAKLHGDPVFAGFDGSTFVFSGIPNKTYNILSTESCQLNAYFVDAELAPGSTEHAGQVTVNSTAPNGTFVAALAFQFGDVAISVEVDRMGKLTALKVNGADVLPAADKQFELRLPHDVTVEYQKFRPWYGQSVNITSPDFDMIFYPTLAHLDKEDYNIRGHLNAHVMSIHITSDEVEYVHGILGQTLRRAEPGMLGGGVTAQVSDVTEGIPATSFTIEGAESDYMVSGLFARDFTFNQLADHEPVLQLARRRRVARKSL